MPLIRVTVDAADCKDMLDNGHCVVKNFRSHDLGSYSEAFDQANHKNIWHLLEQLKDPVNNRPVRKRLKVHRERKYDRQQAQWVTRPGYKNRPQGNPKPGTQYIKKTSFTLIPEKALGMCKLFDMSLGVAIMCDIRLCKYKADYVWLTNASSVSRFWLSTLPEKDWGSEKEVVPYMSKKVTTLDDIRKDQSQQFARYARSRRSFNIPLHNEILVSPSADSLRGIAIPSDSHQTRLIAQYRRQNIIDTLNIALPIFIAEPGSTPIYEYTQEMQLEDLATVIEHFPESSKEYRSCMALFKLSAEIKSKFDMFLALKNATKLDSNTSKITLKMVESCITSYPDLLPMIFSKDSTDHLSAISDDTIASAIFSSLLAQGVCCFQRNELARLLISSLRAKQYTLVNLILNHSETLLDNFYEVIRLESWSEDALIAHFFRSAVKRSPSSPEGCHILNSNSLFFILKMLRDLRYSSRDQFIAWVKQEFASSIITQLLGLNHYLNTWDVVEVNAMKALSEYISRPVGYVSFFNSFSFDMPISKSAKNEFARNMLSTIRDRDDYRLLLGYPFFQRGVGFNLIKELLIKHGLIEASDVSLQEFGSSVFDPYLFDEKYTFSWFEKRELVLDLISAIVLGKDYHQNLKHFLFSKDEELSGLVRSLVSPEIVEPSFDCVSRNISSHVPHTLQGKNKDKSSSLASGERDSSLVTLSITPPPPSASPPPKDTAPVVCGFKPCFRW